MARRSFQALIEYSRKAALADVFDQCPLSFRRSRAAFGFRLLENADGCR